MTSGTPVVAGIDLGTTFSAIAYIDDNGRPVIIPNSDNERITPSVVLFDEEEIIVGTIARASTISAPDQVVQFIKREMGNQEWERNFGGKKYTPEGISAVLLKKIVEDAQKQIQRPIKDVVITVPAYFGDIERKFTQDAGEIAGLNVLGIINEPTAAALAYGIDKLGQEQKILVYDLGGGTFDVSILKIYEEQFQVIGTDGEVQLGGKDWDDEIINYVAELFMESYNLDPRDDPDSYHALRNSAETAKITLTKKQKARIVCQSQGHTLRTELTREKFEELTQSLLAQTETYLPIVLEKAGLKAAEIDTVLPAGGSTRMPQVRNLIKRFFGKEPADTVNPDECVAMGAALYAAKLKLMLNEDAPSHDLPEAVENKLSGIVIRDVTAHSLGVIAKEKGIRKNCVLISQQTPIPIEKSEIFGTEVDNQTRVLVEVVEGESNDPEECVPIGNCLITDLPPYPAGAPIQVTFSYNKNGRIVVQAIDQQSGKKTRTEIVREYGLTQDSIETHKKELAQTEVG